MPLVKGVSEREQSFPLQPELQAHTPLLHLPWVEQSLGQSVVATSATSATPSTAAERATNAKMAIKMAIKIADLFIIVFICEGYEMTYSSSRQKEKKRGNIKTRKGSVAFPLPSLSSLVYLFCFFNSLSASTFSPAFRSFLGLSHISYQSAFMSF